MKIKKYLYDLLDLPTHELEEFEVAKGIGYEVSYIQNTKVVKVKLIGQIDTKLLKHLLRQIFSFGKNNKIACTLLDLNHPFELTGRLMPLRNIGQRKSAIRLVVVLLPDWSEKKNHIRFLNLMGYQTVRFFFSFAGAINWITAQNNDGH
ncbi:MAG: hypothetical protein R8N23_12220 [Reichenbachiella sp.]|uniref:hypothetical protein n=1 Tax=Reichenbachiella sp. TaxID=2184521 RepID=UPI002966CEA4|nr:hypothetical protein [Reichenbachiella sp.]MDW3210631.1 hypothetical protein [Reichenbachiella sp.]